MSFECWIYKAKKHNKCVMLVVFPRQQRLCERASMFTQKLSLLCNIETYNTKASSMLTIDIIVSHVFTSWNILHWTEFLGVFEMPMQLTIIKPYRTAQVDATDTTSRPAYIRTRESFQTVTFSPLFGALHSSLPLAIRNVEITSLLPSVPPAGTKIRYSSDWLRARVFSKAGLFLKKW